MKVEFVPLRREQPGTLDTVAWLWNTACGPDLAIRARAVEYYTRSTTGVLREGRIAMADGQPVGFVLVDAVLDEQKPRGCVDALAVLPEFQNKGIGRSLLAWAEDLARSRKAPSVSLGASPRWFTAGLPAQLQNRAIFERFGYTFAPELTWDCARSLKDYQTPEKVLRVEGDVHPLQPHELPEFLQLLARDFAGGWELDVNEHLKEGGPLEDFIVLRTSHGLDAFCWITHSGSFRPLDRYFPHGLPRPWGQLGMVGVAVDRRGAGLSLKLLDGALHHLIALGVDGCIIDWTGYLSLYAKVGFRPYRCYYSGGKEL